MYAENLWYVAASCVDILPDEPLAVMVAGHAIVLYRTATGAVAALADRCCHRAAPLSLGRVEGDGLRCLYHGLKFDAQGCCIEIPGQPQIPKSARVPAYPVVEADTWVWLWIGDASRADPALIPKTTLDREGWQYRRGHLDYDAQYHLINDNLTDFSHVAYVHAATLGRGAEEWAHELPKVTALDNGVRVQRWVAGAEPLPMDRRLLGVRVDLWTDYEYLLPGVLSLSIQYHPLGTAEACSRQPPQSEPLHASYSAQAVTPLDEHRTRYFYSSATRLQDDHDGVELFHGISVQAFAEDKRMIEAQQRRIDAQPKLPFVSTLHDAGLTRFRRLMAAKTPESAPLSDLAAVSAHALPAQGTVLTRYDAKASTPA